MKQVTFRPKSGWQKEDCINNSAEHTCPNESTLEAVCGDAIVRCCTNKDCMARVAELARQGGFSNGQMAFMTRIKVRKAKKTR